MLRRARTVSWRLAAHAKRRIGARAHLLFLAVLATGMGSCKKLPSSVPYAADLSEKGAVDGLYRIKELVGTELRLDGRALGSLQLASLSSQITVSWTGARADLGSVMNGKYTVAVTGACGDVDHPVEGPYANFRNRSESDLAKLVELDHQLRVPLSLVIPRRIAVFIDRGAKRNGTLKIGTFEVPAGTERVGVVVEGCSSNPTVTWNGAPIGSLDLGARWALVTTEPDVCHRVDDVAYGSTKKRRPPTRYPAKQVLALQEEPTFFLKAAPSSTKLPTTLDGVTYTQLVREECR